MANTREPRAIPLPATEPVMNPGQDTREPAA